MPTPLFVQRFLAPADDDARPDIRYDAELSMSVGPDGQPFVEQVGMMTGATETRAGRDRDRADEVTKQERDRPRAALDMWTRTGTGGRDPGK